MQEQILFSMLWGKSSSSLLITFRRSGRKGAIEKNQDDANDDKLSRPVDNPDTPDLRLILSSKHTGS